MTDIPIKIQFVKSLSTAQPSRIVAVKADSDTAFSLFVTDKTGISYPLKDLQNNVIITNTDGNLQITSSSTSTNINLASSILATINSALQSGDNISELVNDVGYLTSFTEIDPIFQASEASNFVSGDKANLDNQSGINSGDQDSIVGISGTKAQFNTELTDGNFLFVGDVSNTPDATTTSKGVIKLAGDLAGTADAPTVPGLANKVDKVAGERLINASEITKLSQQSGTNTGDETLSTIKTKLGVTTLSGSNTGDETTTSLKSKIDVELAYACSDETSNLTVGNLISFRVPFAMILSSIRISVNDAPTVSSVVVDVKEGGVSIFSTLLSIDSSELTSVTAAVPAVISDINLADDALITVSTTQIGSGNTGKGLKILFKGKKV